MSDWITGGEVVVVVVVVLVVVVDVVVELVVVDVEDVVFDEEVELVAPTSTGSDTVSASDRAESSPQAMATRPDRATGRTIRRNIAETVAAGGDHASPRAS